MNFVVSDLFVLDLRSLYLLSGSVVQTVLLCKVEFVSLLAIGLLSVFSALYLYWFHYKSLRYLLKVSQHFWFIEWFMIIPSLFEVILSLFCGSSFSERIILSRL